MKGLRFLACAAVAGSAVLLSSCIDGREEVWIEADGSGRAEITYSIPARAVKLKGGDAAVSALIRSFLDGRPEITRSDCEVKSSGETTRIHLHTAFDSALALKDAADGVASVGLPAAVGHLAGVVETRLQGRTLAFSRTIRPDLALPGSSLLPSSVFQDRRLSYIMHLPAAPDHHNATRTENGGRTLIWEKTLEEAINAPLVTRFRMDVPLPWKWIGPVVAGMSGIAWLAVRRLKRSSTSEVRGA